MSPWILEGEGFRYEVPAGFVRIDHRGLSAYRGTVQGAERPAELTLWATRDRFVGDLLDLLEWELAQIRVGGGRRPSDDELAAGLMHLDVAGTAERAEACRFWLDLPGTRELRMLVVSRGAAFVFHCATPDVPGARTNFIEECLARAATFQIVPGLEANGTRNP